MVTDTERVNETEIDFVSFSLLAVLLLCKILRYLF